MTGKQILEELKWLSEEELNLPVMATDSRSGESFEVSIYGEVITVTGDEEAGELLSMEVGEKYIWGSVG